MSGCRHAALLLLVYLAGAAASGASLRGALEALQRRQRARAEAPGPYRLGKDYDMYGPLQYDDEPNMTGEGEIDPEYQKYILRYLNEDVPVKDEYIENKNKKSPDGEHKQSAFRERALKHNIEDERLKQLFVDRDDDANKKVKMSRVDNDAEYAMLLNKLWTKYKNHRPNLIEIPSEGIVKMYKERKMQKRQYPDDDNWGPVAFKRKRSPSEHEEDDDSEPGLEDYPALEYPLKPDDRYKYTHDDSNSEINKPESDNTGDMAEEYIAFQPLEGDKIDLQSDGDEYSFEGIMKPFPVSKRSGSFQKVEKKRSTSTKINVNKHFRSNSGTDPQVLRDLSKLFGESGDDIARSPVKRSNANEESHESKPPQITATTHNHTHDNNSALHIHEDGSHEHQGHGAHPPNISGKEEILEIPQTSHTHHLTLKKKSIDWSQYFGIDKRKKKSVSYHSDVEKKLRKDYDDIFDREVMQKHNKVKRDYGINKPIDESEFEIDRASIAIRSDSKRNSESTRQSKLNKMDQKLASVEKVIVDEAVHLADTENLDSKEQEELKEKMLSRLAAAYSLEKMRKALKEFKQTLNTPRDSANMKPEIMDKSKQKRIAVKKEKAELKLEDISSPKSTDVNSNSIAEEFESEQGAGLYLNGERDEPISEGYMGGSGRPHAPVKSQGGVEGDCPVLDRIVQRCHGIDALSGDHGQIFLPLCSLHQICYLCGEAAPTTCDLIFLSEADTTCEGDGACARAARSSLMAMRELHENQADDLDGECGTSPCLADALRRNLGWSHTVTR